MSLNLLTSISQTEELTTRGSSNISSTTELNPIYKMLPRDYYRGESVRFKYQWRPNEHYFHDEYATDFVIIDNTLLGCTKNHLSTLDNKPVVIWDEDGQKVIGIEDSEYWKFVAYIKGEAGEKHPYISIERLRPYLYSVTFDELPEDNGEGVPEIVGCSSYVKDGKLYTNLDWDYDETASFIINTRDFEGQSFVGGLNDGHLNDEKIAQLPYRIHRGVNNYGIKLAAHILYNDWEWTGCGERNINLTRLPFLVLTKVKSMNTIESDLEGVLDNLYCPEGLTSLGYLLQLIVTDGETTYIIMPPTNEGESYILQDATSNPKLANFRWVSNKIVNRSALQLRPTGVERWNMMPCPLKWLQFTRAYEAPDRLSEFIGLRGTTKDSTDAQLLEIYDVARSIYLERERDGQTWQTMESSVYGNRLEALFIQENWEDNILAPADALFERGEGNGSIVQKTIKGELVEAPCIAKGIGAIATGIDTEANSDYSSAEGMSSMTLDTGTYPGWMDGVAAHAEGNRTTAGGRASHTEGDNTIANNIAEHAEGRYNVSHFATNEWGNAGNTIHSVGIGSESPDLYFENSKNAFEIMQNGDFYLYGIGNYVGKEIHTNDASIKTLQQVMTEYPFSAGAGINSAVLKGGNNIASGTSSVAEGAGTQAKHDWAHSEGEHTYVTGKRGHSEGDHTIAGGTTTINSEDRFDDATATITGTFSNCHAEGKGARANANNAHAEGVGTLVTGTNSHGEGYHTEVSGTNAHGEGDTTAASGQASHSEGYHTVAGNLAAHSEGYETEASGNAGHSEGVRTYANGDYSHAEGSDNEVNFNTSHVEGYMSYIGDLTDQVHIPVSSSGTGSSSGGGTPIEDEETSIASHAEGYNSFVGASFAHAEGNRTTAAGASSHAEGYCTETHNVGEHAEGVFNKSNHGSTSAANTVHSIGIGAVDIRKNAIEVMQNGDAYLIGVGGYDGTNPEDATSLQEAFEGVDDIKDLIPAQATPENQLADKEFVNSSIATQTATFRGTFNAYDGGIVIDDVVEQDWVDDSIHRLFGGIQFSANNLGTIDVNATRTPDPGSEIWYIITFNVIISNSLGERLETTFVLDRNNRESEVFFVGYSNRYVKIKFGIELEVFWIERLQEDGVMVHFNPNEIKWNNTHGATIAEPNDYLFNVRIDSAGNNLYDRYKYSDIGSIGWDYEYTLNNSSFTAAQWAAISSGITSQAVTKLSALPTNAQLTTTLAGKQDKLIAGAGITIAPDGKTISAPGGASDPVRYNTVQSLTDTQKAQARTNISANKELNQTSTETATEFVFKAGKGTGIASFDEIRGNSVVWNQLVEKTQLPGSTTAQGITFTNNNDGSITLNGTAAMDYPFNFSQKNSVIAGHKYLIFGGETGFAAFNIYDATLFGGGGKSNTIVTAIASGVVANERLFTYSGKTYNNYKIYPQLVDLTLMGIADKITTPEDFTALYGSGYKEYNPGQLLSFKGEGLKTIGVNQWDELWEVGKYDIANGNKIVDVSSFRSKNFIEVLPQQYYVLPPAGKTMQLLCYDGNKELIKGWNSGYNHKAFTTGATFTPPSNTCYFAFHILSATTYNHDIQIALYHSGGEIPTTYHPYEEHTLALPITTAKASGVTIFPDGARSAGTVYDNFHTIVNGAFTKATKRIGVYDLGDAEWVRYKGEGENYDFAAVIPDMLGGSGVDRLKGIICSRYSLSSQTAAYSPLLEDKCYLKVGTAPNASIHIRDDAYTTAADFKAAMSGVYLFYELATPVDYTLDEPIPIGPVSAEGTLQLLPVNGSTPTTTPMIATIKYGYDANSLIQRLPLEFDTMPFKSGAVSNSAVLNGGDNKANGHLSVAIGNKTIAGTSSTGGAFAEGNTTQALGDASHAEGYLSVASGNVSHAEGSETLASSNSAHAEGHKTTASTYAAHAEGYESTASGDQSHAEGVRTVASGEGTHAEGWESTASGKQSHAEGNNTTSSGQYSHAEGCLTTAQGNYSHAEGKGGSANGNHSHTEGFYTIASNDYEHAQGFYNKSNTGSSQSARTIHSIGIGANNSNRKNAIEVMQSGSVFIKDIGGYDGTNPNSSHTVQSVFNRIPLIVRPTPTDPMPKSGTITFDPEKMYDITLGVGPYTLALTPATITTYTSTYSFIIRTGATAPLITWPTGVVFQSGQAPTIAANKVYEMSIENNLAIVVEYE